MNGQVSRGSAGEYQADERALIPARADSSMRTMIRYRQEHHIIIKRSVL